jgi:hypothetical protein
VHQLVHQHLVGARAEERLATLPPGFRDNVELAVQGSVEAHHRAGLELQERLPEIRVGR